MGFISVSIGEGIGEIFKGLGVDYLIEGGQTMNPSTEDMLNAIEQVNAEHIFILPNNKNIILAANQAKALCEDKDIIVIPTKDGSPGNHGHDQLYAGFQCRGKRGPYDRGAGQREDRSGDLRSA